MSDMSDVFCSSGWVVGCASFFLGGVLLFLALALSFPFTIFRFITFTFTISLSLLCTPNTAATYIVLTFFFFLLSPHTQHIYNTTRTITLTYNTYLLHAQHIPSLRTTHISSIRTTHTLLHAQHTHLLHILHTKQIRIRYTFFLYIHGIHGSCVYRSSYLRICVSSSLRTIVSSYHHIWYIVCGIWYMVCGMWYMVCAVKFLLFQVPFLPISFCSSVAVSGFAFLGLIMAIRFLGMRGGR